MSSISERYVGPSGHWEAPDARKGRVGRVVLLAFCLLAVGGCVAAVAATDDAPPAGSPAVFDQIATSTSCLDLQATFDRGLDGGARAQLNGNDYLVEVTTNYMIAADKRQHALGCPQAARRRAFDGWPE